MKTAGRILIAAMMVATLFAGAAMAQVVPGQNIGSVVLERDGGGSVDLSLLKRPFVVAIFVPGDKNAATQLAAAQKILGAKKYSKYDYFVMTRGKDSAEQKAARDFLRGSKISATLLFDQKSVAAKKFGVSVFPAFYVIDRGVLRAGGFDVVTKPIRKRSFEQFLNMIDKKQVIPAVDMVPVTRFEDKAYKMIGKAMPDFSLQAVNGKNYKLSDLKGRNVILIYWSTSCPHCLREIPKVQGFYNSYRDQYGFEVLAITQATDAESRKELDRILQTNMISYPVLLDKGGKVADAYGIKSVPVAYFINKKGVLTEYLSGEVHNFGPVYHSIFNDPLRLGGK